MQHRNILIYGVSWLGDSIMAMPALRHFFDAHPADRVSILVKPDLMPLWGMFPGLAGIRSLGQGLPGLGRAIRDLLAERWHAAYLMPHSSQSAITAFCAGIPERIGTEAHELKILLTRVVSLPKDPRHHGALEYANLLGVAFPATPPPPPSLVVSSQVRQAAADLLDHSERWFALIPGAARGPSKRWPAPAFIEVGRRLVSSGGGRCAIVGSHTESALCQTVCDGIGHAAINLAGKTDLPRLAAVLGHCSVAVTNDSGGMHLAAAMGTPVVAIFGITDPLRTGPLGNGHSIMVPAGVRLSRDIGRSSARARRALESIAPEHVAIEALKIMRGRNHPSPR